MPEWVGERIEVSGIVQGVGFRPFVHRLATALGLDGHVGNDSTQVFIEIFGPSTTVDRFVEQMKSEAPRLAHIERIERAPVEPMSKAGFRIVQSRPAAGAKTLLSPDTALCFECRKELFDSSNRRFGHPFITCTNCGPRFTIVESLPYDRPNTTMKRFVMCDCCESEYRDPTNRRFHAQPLACHDCGPTLSFWMPDQPKMADGDPVVGAVNALASGLIVAVKGLGGYHLTCDATDDDAVHNLRLRKYRPEKPFAIMVADIAAAREIAVVSDSEAVLLQSDSAPIVLLCARRGNSLASQVAPGNPLIGVMLAYTPIQHLIFAHFRQPMVVTSANRPGDPIVHRTSAIHTLGDLFDALLDHDRPIATPCDDSVVRVVGSRLLPIRRARGYAPVPVRFPRNARSVLAAGGEFKSTFCVTSDGHAWVSQHVGHLENLETLRVFESSIRQFLDLYEVELERVAADAHPAYHASKWAQRNYPDRVVEVQHHHAHVAAVMAEHQLDPDELVLGFAFDGTGYGDDGTIWGGELLVANADGYERVAHLAAIPLPGGDAAIRNPCRVALSHLYSAGIDWTDGLSPLEALNESERVLLRRQLETGAGCVPTTSMGRLFDGVAALIGLRQQISYEAQAAIDLEFAAGRSRQYDGGYRFDLIAEEIVPRPVLLAIVDDLKKGVDVDVIAWRFHDGVADMVNQLANRERRSKGINTVVLSGGVFQNVLLLKLCIERLEASSFRVHSHELVPPNDGGLALGQAFVAACGAFAQED